MIGTGGLLRRAPGVTHCILAESEDGLLLVDTGIGTRDCLSPTFPVRWMLAVSGSPRDVGETALRQVQRLGYAPGDVRHIALTHGHFDHAGGLPDFPQASVHVYAREYEALTRPEDIYERYPYRAEHWAHSPQWVVHELRGERWFGFDCTPAIDLGALAFRFVPLPGHTRGHSAIALRFRDGWLLHCGDAYTFHGEVDPDAPRRAPYARSVRRLMNLNKALRPIGAHSGRLRALVQAHGSQVTLTCSHDPHEYNKFVSA